MEIKDFISEIKNMELVAHRLGFDMTKYPENSLDSLKEIFNSKELLESCDGFEFDICFTKDNIPVLSHDKYIDDISNTSGYIKQYTLEELKNINFTFRKSLYEFDKNYSYKILTLEDTLEFFQNNKKLLKNKIIKIETKEAFKINKKNMLSLAHIINKYPDLNNNLIHLSYWPQNLIILKRIQNKYNYKHIKTDLLCDYKIMVYLAHFIKSINNISLRIKMSFIPKYNCSNSKRVNRKILIDSFFMKLSNTINEKLLNYVIKKYKKVGIFVLNDVNEIDTICNKISYNFIKNNKQNIAITTDNPLNLLNMKKK